MIAASRPPNSAADRSTWPVSCYLLPAVKSTARCIGLLLGLLAEFHFVQPAIANNSVHLSYHWHLHQPIYWPEHAPGGFNNRYQFGKESVDLKLSNSGNYYAGSRWLRMPLSTSRGQV